MVVIVTRSGIQVPAWHPSVAAIIGIALGGSAFLGVLVALSIVVRVKTRHRRAVAILEQQALSRRVNALEGDYAQIMRSQRDLKQNMQATQVNHAGWGQLSSKEDLPIDANNQYVHPTARKKTDTRASDFLWPFSPKRRSQRGVPLKRLKRTHLSAIIESPKCGSKSPGPNESEEMILGQPSIKEEPSQASLAISEYDSTCNGSGSPKETIQPSAALKPDPLFSGRSGTTGSDDARSYSVPSIFIPVPSDAILGKTTRSFQHNRRSRSISLGTGQEMMGPQAPLPPLPNGVVRENRHSTYTIEHPSSRNSVSSQESTSSSILKTTASPSMKAVAEFSRRHPEMGLGAQIRENETDLKNSLIGGPRSAQPRTNPPVKLHSSHGSFIMSSVQDFYGGATDDRQMSFDDAPRFVPKPSSRYYSGQGLAIENARVCRMPSNSNLKVSSVTLGSSPPRQSSGSKVSANGSPRERHRMSGTSILRDVSGNSTLPIREESRNWVSVQSQNSLSDDNPFQWKKSPATARKSALKSTSAHKSQNSVRISEIPEESVSGGFPPSDEIGIAHSHDLGLDSRPLPRPPSTSTFDPELKVRPPSFRASFARSSPAFSVTQYYREMQDSGIGNQSFRYSKQLEDDSNRLSTNSSLNEFPTFPIPAQTTKGSIFSFADTVNMRRAQPTLEYTSCKTDLNPSPNSASPECDDHTPYFERIPNKRRLSPVLVSSNPPSSLTPSPKASATTMLSSAALQSKPLPTPRFISPTNPMKTKPDLQPPKWDEMEVGGSAKHPEVTPVQGVVKTIKALRRMDSETLGELAENKERWQQLGLGRDESPDRTQVNLFKEAASRRAEEEKENRLIDPNVRDSVVSEFENESQIQALATPKLGSSAKKVAWGGVEVRERSASATPKSSLYDGDGFLMI